jgi:cell wall-associated NlpC family hydrolase
MVISPPVAQGQANANELSVKSNITLGEVKTKARASQSLLAKPISTYKIGLKYLGTPYCKGGRGPNCFDCSGFTQYIYKKKGKEIARTTGGQYKQSKKIARSDAKVGDLVFFSSSGGHIYHVGIYAGNGEVLHSPKPGRSVKIEKIWSKKVQFRRL